MEFGSGSSLRPQVLEDDEEKAASLPDIQALARYDSEFFLTQQQVGAGRQVNRRRLELLLLHLAGEGSLPDQAVEAGFGVYPA